MEKEKFNKEKAFELLKKHYIVGQDFYDIRLKKPNCLNDLVQEDNYYYLKNGVIYDKFNDIIEDEELPNETVYYLRKVNNDDFLENMIFNHKDIVIGYIFSERNNIKTMGVKQWLKEDCLFYKREI